MPDPAIDYEDVQGTILRGYRVDLARHFVLAVADAAAARALVGALVDGRDGLPRITTAGRWTVKPQCFANIGFTAAGLRALGVTAAQLATFDEAFQRGATDPKTAQIVGDVGESAPSRWIGGLGDGAQVHLLLSVWVHEDSALLESITARLRAAFAGALRELYAHDAKALPANRVHFGYRDSIAQPTILGAPSRKAKHDAPDGQPPVPTGEFLLGYLDATPRFVRVQPSELSRNSSYAAFRILEQDVVGFETFLAEEAPKHGLDPELLAAKLCGRWRNGNPWVLAPDAQGAVLPSDKLNDFHYRSADPAQDDTIGLKCPIGSHTRRNNPRDQAVVGTDSTHHRIVRRAMPYGPEYDPRRPEAVPRGLVGYFINASLTNQFEFLTNRWNRDSKFVKAATGPGGRGAGNATFNISGEDPFLGVNDPEGSSFTLPGLGELGKNNKRVRGFPRFVTTRGGAYVFLPSISGLRYLSKLRG